MAKPAAAMEKNEIKAQLRRAVSEPIHCALGLGPDPAAALLLVDKIKPGKRLLSDLQKDFPGLKMPAFGTAQVNPEDESKLDFRLNKVPSGSARRLVKALRGTGIKSVSLIGEDGSTEAGAEEEGEEAGVAGPGSPAAVAPAVPAAAADAAPAAVPDEKALVQRLRDLVGQIRGVIASAPQRQGELAGLATAAQASLKDGDPAGASAKLDALEQALHSAPATVGGKDATAGAVAYGKARLAWIAVRKRMVAETDQLAAALQAEYADAPEARQIMASYRARVAPMLASLDEGLADKLDEAVNAQDAQKRAALVGEARQIIASYQAFIAGETLVADLDGNPFVPLSIAKTLTTTLSTLSASVR